MEVCNWHCRLSNCTHCDLQADDHVFDEGGPREDAPRPVSGLDDRDSRSKKGHGSRGRRQSHAETMCDGRKTVPAHRPAVHGRISTQVLLFNQVVQGVADGT